MLSKHIAKHLYYQAIRQANIITYIWLDSSQWSSLQNIVLNVLCST